MSGKHYHATYKAKRTGTNTKRRTIWLATSPILINKMDQVAIKQLRTLPELVRLCCSANFGLTRKERKCAEEVLEPLRRKYNK